MCMTMCGPPRTAAPQSAPSAHVGPVIQSPGRIPVDRSIAHRAVLSARVSQEEGWTQDASHVPDAVMLSMPVLPPRSLRARFNPAVTGDLVR